MWTQFWDMHSGGGQKEDFSHCYIEAPEDQAKLIFYNRFGHNPDRVSCTCCGPDYSIYEYNSLEEATSFQRNAQYVDGIEAHGILSTEPHLSVAEYKQLPTVCIIDAASIKPEDLLGDLPEQGFVWQD